MQPLNTIYGEEIEIWLKSHPYRVVTHYRITGLIGKAYLKLATATIAANAFWKKKACFSATVTCFINMILEESQHNITSCLFDNPTPHTRMTKETACH